MVTKTPTRMLIYALVAVTAFIAVAMWRDPAFRELSIATLPTRVDALALNLVPILIVLALLVAITARPLASLWIVLLALWTIYSANTLKIIELGTPLMPGDVLLLGNLGHHGAGLMLRYVPFDARHVVELIAVLAVTALLFRREPRARSMTATARVALGALALILAGTALDGTPPWRSLYLGDAAHFKLWSPLAHERRNGLFAHLVAYTWETRAPLPAPDRDAALTLIARHRDAQPVAMAPDGLPDIVILQSESFFDAARLRGLDARDVLPNLRRVAAESRHGDLAVPTYGGGTIRTEFEVLTGIAMRYFPETQYPYFRLTAKAPVRGIVSVLAARGYDCIAIHPHDRGFWNRAAAFSNMGFAAFDAEDAFAHAPRQGYYVSDAALIDHLIARLDAAPSPVFVFAISMENHGPYDHYPNADEARRAGEPTPPGLAADAARELRGYLYHAENADRALGRLVDAIAARPRRTLLLFYGDHLPALPEVYPATGFDDGADAHDEPVPWILFDSADRAPRAAETSASFFLPALLLAVAGIDDPYFRTLEAVRRASPGAAPPDEDGLAAIMQARERGDFEALARPLLAAARPACARGASCD